MADLTITVANVVPGKGAQIQYAKAGAAIAAGKTVYFDPADQRFKLADCDNASPAVRAAYGIAVNSAEIGQPLGVQFGGELALGAILAAGEAYYLSPNAGGIAPRADILSGDHTVLLGFAKSTSVLTIDVTASGAALA